MIRDYSDLKNRLRRSGISQREAADCLGLKPTTFTNKLAGYGAPFTYQELKKIHGYIKKHIEELVNA